MFKAHGAPWRLERSGGLTLGPGQQGSVGCSKGVVAFTLLDWGSGGVWGQGGLQPNLGFERRPSCCQEESRLEGRKGRNRERGLGTVSGRVQSGLGSAVAREGGAGMVSDAGCFQGGADQCGVLMACL